MADTAAAMPAQSRVGAPLRPFEWLLGIGLPIMWVAVEWLHGPNITVAAPFLFWGLTPIAVLAFMRSGAPFRRRISKEVVTGLLLAGWFGALLLGLVLLPFALFSLANAVLIPALILLSPFGVMRAFSRRLFWPREPNRRAVPEREQITLWSGIGILLALGGPVSAQSIHVKWTKDHIRLVETGAPAEVIGALRKLRDYPVLFDYERDLVCRIVFRRSLDAARRSPFDRTMAAQELQERFGGSTHEVTAELRGLYRADPMTFCAREYYTD